MGERVVSGNFCRYGMRVIVTKVLSGEWPLEEVFQSNRCFCNCGNPHSWMCLERFHQKNVRLSPEDAATFVKANYTRIRQRKNLVAELVRIRRGTHIDGFWWAYVFHPIIKDMPRFQRHLRALSNNAGHHGYTRALMSIGVARKRPTFSPQGYDEDMLLYFALMQPHRQGTTIRGSIPFGKYSIQFPRIVWKALHDVGGLHPELVLAIFNLTYRCHVTSTHFNRIFLE